MGPAAAAVAAAATDADADADANTDTSAAATAVGPAPSGDWHVPLAELGQHVARFLNRVAAARTSGTTGLGVASLSPSLAPPSPSLAPPLRPPDASNDPHQTASPSHTPARKPRSMLTRFHAKKPPPISVDAYLTRIIRYTPIEPPFLLVILVYLDRYWARYPHFVLSSLTVHRFVMATIVVASKLYLDRFASNAYFAKVAGTSLAELNALELELCLRLDWDLGWSDALLADYHHAMMETLQRPPPVTTASVAASPSP